MNQNSKAFVAGHSGLVGSALCHALSTNYTVVTKPRSELDLRTQSSVDHFFSTEKIETVFLAAAHVGGIQANIRSPAEFIYDNLAIATHVIHAAFEHGVKELVYFGSSCMYPAGLSRPMEEASLLTGLPEATSLSYAVAKIAGLQMCSAYSKQYQRRYLSLIPSNLYGPHDNFDLLEGHVIPNLIRRFHEGKRRGQKNVTVWGSGAPQRDFLYIEDLVSATLHILETYKSYEPINVSSGVSVSIRELASTIREITGYTGNIVWDTSKPEGALQKTLDHKKTKELGWSPKFSMAEGLRRTYEWALSSGKLND